MSHQITPLLNSNQIRTRLNVSRSQFLHLTCKELHRHGLFKVGNTWRMEQEDLEKYIDNQKKQNQ